jgi:hypothetical protein
VPAKTRVGNILATANNGFRQRQAPQLRTQAERAVQQLGKAARILAVAEQRFRFAGTLGGGQARDLTFDERQFYASDARQFPSAENR